jgi:hypothetical protein
MSEELIQQEFFCSAEAPLVGAYYAKEMLACEKDGRITRIPWEPRLRVDTYWDLGMDDSTSIWFVQQRGTEIRLIDYYENSGEGLAHYAKNLRERDYVYGEHFAPWDIEVRELSTGKSRRETAKDLGIRFRIVQRHEVLDGIDSVRNTIPRCYFDAEKCSRGVEALRQYRKEYDDVNKCYAGHPVKDWTCHGSDAFRYLCWQIKGHAKKPQARPATADSDYNIYGS